MLRFRHNEPTHSWRWLKWLNTHFIKILKVFDLWNESWPHYIWHPLCQVIFVMNVIHAQTVWLFDTWHINSIYVKIQMCFTWKWMYSANLVNILLNIFSEHVYKYLSRCHWEDEILVLFLLKRGNAEWDQSI